VFASISTSVFQTKEARECFNRSACAAALLGSNVQCFGFAVGFEVGVAGELGAVEEWQGVVAANALLRRYIDLPAVIKVPELLRRALSMACEHKGPSSAMRAKMRLASFFSAALNLPD